MGCKVEGVPGFYRDDCGYWTMAFYKKTSGILIPAVGFDGRLQGFQIMLDVPLKDKDDPPEKLAPNTSGSLLLPRGTALHREARHTWLVIRLPVWCMS